jgi:tetratricopeptide (TPR) repeat protein
LLALAKVEISLGNHQQARKRLLQAGKLDSQNPQVGLLTVEAYLALKQNRQAVEEIRFLSAQFPQNAALQGQLSLMLLGAGAFDEAAEKFDLTHKLDPAVADEVLEQAFRVTPDSPKIHLVALDRFHEWNRLAFACDALERRISQAPENPLYAMDLVQCHILAGEISSAKEQLRIFARRFAQDGTLHAALGEWLLDQRQEEMALSELLRAQAAGIQEARFVLALATLQAQSGAYLDAVRNAVLVEKQSSIDPRVCAAAALLAGLSYMSAGQDKEAIEHLRHAVELAPDIEANYLALARIFEVLGDYKSAVDVLTQGRLRTSASPDLLVALGSDLVSIDKFDQTIEILSTIISRYPEKTNAYRPLARAYQSTGKVGLGADILRKLLERQSQDTMLRLTFVQFLIEEGRSGDREALEQLAKAEKATHADPDIYFLRGKIYFAQGEYEKAVTALLQAVNLQPSSAPYHYHLAMAYRRLGKQAQALEQLQVKAHLERRQIPDLTKQ